ncbi:MAG: hypothetical protein M9894_16310 [Planctomycetes bacterium]|nr:hypothetical protein [Planctomycetota bacterium]
MLRHDLRERSRKAAPEYSPNLATEQIATELAPAYRRTTCSRCGMHLLVAASSDRAACAACEAGGDL